MAAVGRVQRKAGLRFTPIEYTLSGSNRRLTYEVVFIPFRPKSELCGYSKFRNNDSAHIRTCRNDVGANPLIPPSK
jgi:hypothetical protein